jgi:hypothetical protein
MNLEFEIRAGPAYIANHGATLFAYSNISGEVNRTRPIGQVR